MDAANDDGLPPGLRVSTSFSNSHRLLWEICNGTVKVTKAQDIPSLNEPQLETEDLSKLADMVKAEFWVSFQKELDSRDEEEWNLQASPAPFDVFLMESTGRVSATSRPKVAVCLPMKFLRRPKGVARLRPPLMWFDGTMYLPLEPKIHVRRVASLSGPARILTALHNDPRPGSLMKWGMQRSMLVDAVPFEEVESCNLRAEYISRMNESQIRAVATVVSPSFRDGFFAIQGPPGCGKTTTMVGMISAIGQGIIVTAPSNAAVANIALKLFESKRYDIHQLCVFGENCDESVHFLNPKWRSIQYRKFRKKFDDLAEDDVMRSHEVRKFGKWLHLEDENISLEMIARLNPHVDDDNGTDDMKEFISTSLVVFCTLNSAGSGLLMSAVKGMDFSTLMLDEAGQCPEAEFFISTTFPGIKRVIVVGDPKQLPATVIDPVCQQLGYGKSWLGQVFDNFPDNVHLLDTQYRMDPEILAFPNSRFYRGRIKSGASVHGRQPHVVVPFQIVDTQERGREEREGYSWKNVYEAMVIKSILRTDDDIVRIRKETKNATSRTIVITPYKAQRKLLEEEVKKLKGVGKIDVATVDSFQGQEGDIVILSTVRTRDVGFVDSAQRLNVALTRAMRVLRVVGDVKFFLSLPPVRSTLRALAQGARESNSVEASKLQVYLWSRPNWDVEKRWKPRFTERFHHCIKKMSEQDKNACFNTLLALAIPCVKNLYLPPAKQVSPSWQMSGLRGHDKAIRIVWIALEGFRIEAHFAGTRTECLHFTQTNRKLPTGARVVKPDLTDFVEAELDAVAVEKKPIICWPMSNNMQNFISKIETGGLPQGNFCLDPKQEQIASAPPPLMIESRSGTGKTNVLFQHAIFHSRVEGTEPICFVTVSPRLRNELERRYDEVNVTENDLLPRIGFFSLVQFLIDLLSDRGIRDFQSKTPCTFLGYCGSRQSHERLPVDAGLAENEIGGVIMGSLESAQQRSALSRDQYLSIKRSNLDRTQEGLKTRNLVYDEYERYTCWKLQSLHFDQNDVVARLLNEDVRQLFAAAYLDEIQDFSYATIYLICCIAGKHTANWVCAGDTAQMISPGCSFTFDGLKQTLLGVKPGIERHLADVHHLLVNYRTTKDVLDVGNEVLLIAKNHFPGAIEFALPEIAVKDLGLKVVLCDWDRARMTKVSFGPSQAFIFASLHDDESNRQQQHEKAEAWLGNHPFILTSLDSKGLEFEDVVVAFDLDRKVWNTKSGQVASLRMLRELYVAVTRAKRRVVILIKSRDSAMVAFFKNDLHCEVQEPDLIQGEFNNETTPEEWFPQGETFFEDEQFKLAANCFSAAKKYGWSNWAHGNHFAAIGDRAQAANFYRRAAHCFHDDLDFQRTLEIMREIKKCPPWDPSDDQILEEAMQREPTFFTKPEKVEFSLFRGKWDEITTNELKDPSTSVFFRSHSVRGNQILKALIRSASNDDRAEIGTLLPGLIADYHIDKKNLSEAVRLFLLDRDPIQAAKSTEEVIRVAKSSLKELGELPKVVEHWSHHRHDKERLPEKSPTTLLLHLFEAPKRAAAQSAQDCLRILGRNAIKIAVEPHDPLILHDFDRKEFSLEVLTALENTFGNSLIKALDWLMDRGDQTNANALAGKLLKTWTDDELLHDVVDRHRLRPARIFDDLKRRRRLVEATCTLFLSGASSAAWDMEAAIDAGCTMLGFTKSTQAAKEDLQRKIMNQARQSKFFEIHDSGLSMFLDMCHDPEYASVAFGPKCFSMFKKVAVKEAVFFGGPFKVDVLAVLKRYSPREFQTIGPMEALELFRRKNNFTAALWYVQLRLTRWSNEELVELVKSMNYTSEDVLNEFIRRDLYLDAARLSHISNRIDVAATIYANAVRSLLTSSSSSSLHAEESLMHLFQVWCDSFYGSKNAGKVQSMFTDWLCLCSQDPTMLWEDDEFTCLLVKFGPSVARYSRCQPSNDSTPERALELLQRLVSFHDELKERMETLRTCQQATPLSNSSDATTLVDGAHADVNASENKMARPDSTNPTPGNDSVAEGASKNIKRKKKKTNTSEGSTQARVVPNDVTVAGVTPMPEICSGATLDCAKPQAEALATASDKEEENGETAELGNAIIPVESPVEATKKQNGKKEAKAAAVIEAFETREEEEEEEAVVLGDDIIPALESPIEATKKQNNNQKKKAKAAVVDEPFEMFEAQLEAIQTELAASKAGPDKSTKEGNTRPTTNNNNNNNNKNKNKRNNHKKKNRNKKK